MQYVKGVVFYLISTSSLQLKNPIQTRKIDFYNVFFKFKTEQEVIELANNTEFGLAAYFFSKDIARIWRVAEAIEAGMIGINTGIFASAYMPFGGIKQSGIGREGAKYGMEEYLELKTLSFGNIK